MDKGKGKGKARQPEPPKSTANKKVADFVNRVRDGIQPPAGPSSADNQLNAHAPTTGAHEATAMLDANKEGLGIVMKPKTDPSTVAAPRPAMELLRPDVTLWTENRNELGFGNASEEPVPTTNPLKEDPPRHAMELLRPHVTLWIEDTVPTETTPSSESPTPTVTPTSDPFMAAAAAAASEASDSTTSMSSSPDRSAPSEDTQTTPNPPKTWEGDIPTLADPSPPLQSYVASALSIFTASSSDGRASSRPLTWEELWGAWPTLTLDEVTRIRAGDPALEVIDCSANFQLYGYFTNA